MSKKELERQLAKDIKEVVKIFRTLPKEYRGKARKSLLRKPALMFRDAARGNVPVSDKPHYRYKKSIDGEPGEKITYLPGNLKRSLRVLTFRRSPDVFVGPKKKPKNKESAVFGGDDKTVDPYYANFVEKGTSKQPPAGYMRKAYDNNVSKARQVLEQNALKIFNKWKKKAEKK
jgi:HK97 gp10 family phage protein